MERTDGVREARDDGFSLITGTIRSVRLHGRSSYVREATADSTCLSRACEHILRGQSKEAGGRDRFRWQANAQACEVCTAPYITSRRSICPLRPVSQAALTVRFALLTGQRRKGRHPRNARWPCGNESCVCGEDPCVTGWHAFDTLRSVDFAEVSAKPILAMIILMVNIVPLYLNQEVIFKKQHLSAMRPIFGHFGKSGERIECHQNFEVTLNCLLLTNVSVEVSVTANYDQVLKFEPSEPRAHVLSDELGTYRALLLFLGRLRASNDVVLPTLELLPTFEQQHFFLSTKQVCASCTPEQPGNIDLLNRRKNIICCPFGQNRLALLPPSPQQEGEIVTPPCPNPNPNLYTSNMASDLAIESEPTVSREPNMPQFSASVTVHANLSQPDFTGDVGYLCSDISYFQVLPTTAESPGHLSLLKEEGTEERVSMVPVTISQDRDIEQQEVPDVRFQLTSSVDSIEGQGVMGHNDELPFKDTGAPTSTELPTTLSVFDDSLAAAMEALAQASQPAAESTNTLIITPTTTLTASTATTTPPPPTTVTFIIPAITSASSTKKTITNTTTSPTPTAGVNRSFITDAGRLMEGDLGGTFRPDTSIACPVTTSSSSSSSASAFSPSQFSALPDRGLLQSMPTTDADAATVTPAPVAFQGEERQRPDQSTGTANLINVPTSLSLRDGANRRVLMRPYFEKAVVDLLWASGELGPSNPQALLLAMWFYVSRHLGIGCRSDHARLLYGNLSIEVDPQTGSKHVHFVHPVHFGDQTAKLSQPPSHDRILHALPGQPERCPVALFEAFCARRPTSAKLPDSPFYLQPDRNAHGSIWYLRSALGKNKIGSMLNAALQRVGLPIPRHVGFSRFCDALASVVLRNMREATCRQLVDLVTATNDDAAAAAAAAGGDNGRMEQIAHLAASLTASAVYRGSRIGEHLKALWENKRPPSPPFEPVAAVETSHTFAPIHFADETAQMVFHGNSLLPSPKAQEPEGAVRLDLVDIEALVPPSHPRSVSVDVTCNDVPFSPCDVQIDCCKTCVSSSRSAKLELRELLELVMTAAPDPDSISGALSVTVSPPRSPSGLITQLLWRACALDDRGPWLLSFSMWWMLQHYFGIGSRVHHVRLKWHHLRLVENVTDPMTGAPCEALEYVGPPEFSTVRSLALLESHQAGGEICQRVYPSSGWAEPEISVAAMIAGGSLGVDVIARLRPLESTSDVPIVPARPGPDFVALYKAFMRHRPVSSLAPDAPFYTQPLQSTRSQLTEGREVQREVWFSNAALGKNRIGALMRNIVDKVVRPRLPQLALVVKPISVAACRNAALQAARQTVIHSPTDPEATVLARRVSLVEKLCSGLGVSSAGLRSQLEQDGNDSVGSTVPMVIPSAAIPPQEPTAQSILTVLKVSCVEGNGAFTTSQRRIDCVLEGGQDHASSVPLGTSGVILTQADCNNGRLAGVLKTVSLATTGQGLILQQPRQSAGESQLSVSPIFRSFHILE
ncbi:unnamed protein product [Schistocephalus solidus]|uniref:DUF3504 domain-containing protein n=1 Tax=Schistocephalus solidus TaxID=70667 RepID=A0A183T958_SCHSO|nr:unnamed protein product [Schistocephalus solidus]